MSIKNNEHKILFYSLSLLSRALSLSLSISNQSHSLILSLPETTPPSLISFLSSATHNSHHSPLSASLRLQAATVVDDTLHYSRFSLGVGDHPHSGVGGAAWRW
ncbi:hypothetical protein Scep_002520 [Stephania cephalantha]|uniref:Uncharacterized protein n=1 Tax=Stephania cephalantha TaxID=152367 RepID=A0AAP0LEI4_9MAGN